MALYVNKYILEEVEMDYNLSKQAATEDGETSFCVDVTKMAKNSIDGQYGLNVWQFNFDLLRKRTDMYFRAIRKIAHKNGDKIKITESRDNTGHLLITCCITLK